MIIVSRRANIFWWMSMRTRPRVSFSSKVSRSRIAFAVDEEDLVAVVVLDPVVVTEAEEPVAYEVSHAITASPAGGPKRRR